MVATARLLFLEAAGRTLDQVPGIPDREGQIGAIKTARVCLHAGLDEIFAQMDLMEGLGASPMAKEATFRMMLNGEL